MKFNITVDDIRLALLIAKYLRRIGHPEEAEEFEERCLLAVKDEIRGNKLDAAEEKKSEEKQCDCYNPIYARCNGTKEQDECKCGGDESKCDFYVYKRRKHNV